MIAYLGTLFLGQNGRTCRDFLQICTLCALIFALIFVLLNWVLPAEVLAASNLPSSTWQDSDLNYRKSAKNTTNNAVNNAVAKQKSDLTLLPEDAHLPRMRSVQAALVDNQLSLAQNGQIGMLSDGDWRIKIQSAAVTNSDKVRLGDIATPLGQIDSQQWQKMANIALWPAPETEGKPMQISRSRLSQALRQILGQDLSSRCILPTSLVIQRGGMLFTENDLRNYVMRSLAPQLEAMPGDAELTDVKLPEYIFLAHPQQQIQLEVGKLAPGRVTLRFAVQEADGTVIRRVAGLAQLMLWVTLPAAAKPMGKGENLSVDAVTFIRFNAAQLKGVPWDGQGGPWQTTRSLTTGDPILQSDLASQLMVRRGDVVRLIYKRGNVRMETHAEALSDGEPGKTISIKNLQTKKQVYGIVQDGNTVVIQ